MNAIIRWCFRTCAAGILLSSIAHGATSREDLAQARTLARFDAQLERALPATPDARDLRVRVLAWLHQRAADVRANDPLWQSQSVLPWTGAAESAYVAEVEARAQAIVASLMRQRDRADRDGRVVVDRTDESVVEHLAQVYAMLATYRGNLSFQFTAGTLMAYAPTLAVYVGTGAITWYIGHVTGMSSKIWEFLHLQTQVVYAASGIYAGTVTLRLLSPKFREYLRTAGLPGERDAGAARIERAFWDRLRADLKKHRALRDYVPSSGDADFPSFFFSRLDLAGPVTAQCESLLLHPPAQLDRR